MAELERTLPVGKSGKRVDPLVLVIYALMGLGYYLILELSDGIVVILVKLAEDVHRLLV